MGREYIGSSYCKTCRTIYEVTGTVSDNNLDASDTCQTCGTPWTNWLSSKATEKLKLASGVIMKGQTVEVVAGNKIPIGMTGKIAWMGTDKYGNERVGFRTSDGEMLFTNKRNVQAATH